MESNKQNLAFPKHVINTDNLHDVSQYLDIKKEENFLQMNPENFNQNLNEIDSKNKMQKNHTNKGEVVDTEKKIPNLRIDVNKILSKIDSNHFIIKSYNAPKLTNWYLGELNVILKNNNVDFKSNSNLNTILILDSDSIETRNKSRWNFRLENEELTTLTKLEEAGLILLEKKFKEKHSKTQRILEIKVFMKPEFFKKSEEIYSAKHKKFVNRENSQSHKTLSRDFLTYSKLKMFEKLGLKFDDSCLFQFEDFSTSDLEGILTPIKKSSVKEITYDYRSFNKQYLKNSKLSCVEIKKNPISLHNYQIESLYFMLGVEGKNSGEKIEHERIFPSLLTKEGKRIYFNFLDETFGCDSFSYDLKGGILANSEELDSFNLILSLIFVNPNEFSEPQANFSNLVIKTEEKLSEPLKKIQKNKKNSTNNLELELELQNEEKFSGTTLIITSNSGLEDWRQQLEKCPHFREKRVFIHCKTKILLSNFYEKDLVLISYDDLFLELNKFDSKFSRHPFWRIILDQAHYIKSIPTNDFENLLQLRGNFRWCVTPYPIKNYETELAFFLKFLRMKYLGSTRFLWNLKTNNKIVDLMQIFMLRLTPDTLTFPEKSPISKPKIIYKKTWVKLSEDAMAMYKLIDKRPKLFIPFLSSSSAIDSCEPDCIKTKFLRKFCNSPLNIFNQNSFVEQETKKLKLNLALFNYQNIDKAFLRRLLEQIRDEDFDDCSVCMQKPRNVYIFGCGHYLCSLCFAKWSRCPNRCPNLNDSPTLIHNRPYYKHTLDINFKLAKDGYTKINYIVSYIEELILIPDARIKVLSSCGQTLELIQAKLWEQQITSDYFHSRLISRAESNNKVELCILNTNLLLDGSISHIICVDIYGEDFVSLNKNLLDSQLQNLRTIIVRSFICSGTIEEMLYIKNKEIYETSFHSF